MTGGNKAVTLTSFEPVECVLDEHVDLASLRLDRTGRYERGQGRTGQRIGEERG